MAKRYLEKAIKADAMADRKMAFISGPRQVGKTTLGKNLLSTRENYFSWDETEFRRKWVRAPREVAEQAKEGPVLLDEIHKDRKWKTRLKGLYDPYGDKIQILVTGSARLDLYRRGGDSLLGRYIPYRLHPFTVGETPSPPKPDEILHSHNVSFPWHDLMNLGGFPEPLLGGSVQKADRWSRLRLDRLAFEDTRDIKVLSDLNAFRTLLDLIPEKVGSLFSFNSLREDIGVAYATVRDWVLLSENLYYGFFVKPHSKNIKRSIRSEPKFYLYDILQIPKNELAKRRENLTALHLLKACQYWTDAAFGHFELFYVRDKEKREVDFLVCREREPWMLVECKSGSIEVSKSLHRFAEVLKPSMTIQLCEKEGYDRYFQAINVRVMSFAKFFSGLV